MDSHKSSKSATTSEYCWYLGNYYILIHHILIIVSEHDILQFKLIKDKKKIIITQTFVSSNLLGFGIIPMCNTLIVNKKKNVPKHVVFSIFFFISKLYITFMPKNVLKDFAHNTYKVFAWLIYTFFYHRRRLFPRSVYTRKCINTNFIRGKNTEQRNGFYNITMLYIIIHTFYIICNVPTPYDIKSRRPQRNNLKEIKRENLT